MPGLSLIFNAHWFRLPLVEAPMSTFYDLPGADGEVEGERPVVGPGLVHLQERELGVVVTPGFAGAKNPAHFIDVPQGQRFDPGS